jgi:hypothetical protein
VGGNIGRVNAKRRAYIETFPLKEDAKDLSPAGFLYTFSCYLFMFYSSTGATYSNNNNILHASLSPSHPVSLLPTQYKVSFSNK